MAGYIAGVTTRQNITSSGPTAGHALPEIIRPKGDLDLVGSSRDNMRINGPPCHDMIPGVTETGGGAHTF